MVWILIGSTRSWTSSSDTLFDEHHNARKDAQGRVYCEDYGFEREAGMQSALRGGREVEVGGAMRMGGEVDAWTR